uniref:Uncharacterized protein n=1 Tax=Arundo donax TaxID=35708 RepID=A0A0A9A837_ARUDO
MRANTSVRIGNGRCTSFWQDHWIGPMPLASLMHALFSHSRRPNLSVSMACTTGGWELHLQPRITEAAISELTSLHEALQGVQLRPEEHDERFMHTCQQSFTMA